MSPADDDAPYRERARRTPAPSAEPSGRDLQRRLAHEGDLYRLLVQSVRDYAIFMLDPTGIIASWNEGAQRIKGYSATEIIGQHFSKFYPAEDIAAGKPTWELEVAVREGRFEEEGLRLRKDGSLFWANVVITTLRDERGSVVGFAKVTRDLTERRANQERAIEDARRLAAAEVANRAKSEFLAAMSHELRTPLNAIGGFAELMELGLGGPVTGEQRSYLERIRVSQQHLLHIISDLLNYSRIEAGQVTYDLAPILMPELVDTVLALLEPQAVSKGIKLEREPCPPDLAALGDRSKTDQIILNLLSNALKFTPKQGRVTVRCAAVGEVVHVEVHDTGPGIPADQQAEIFEPFVQLGRSLTSTQEGTGLGLSISRDLSRAMNGDVTVKSEVGVGSTFTLILPRA